MRSPTRNVNEAGVGVVLAIGIVAAILGVTALFLGITNRVIGQVRLNALADTASIAAADALRGLVAGYPCDVARELGPVTQCTILGNDVLVEVARDGLTAKSRAGEPG